MIVVQGDQPESSFSQMQKTSDDSHFKQSLAKLENEKKMMQKNLKQM